MKILTINEEIDRIKRLPAGVMTLILRDIEENVKEVVFYVREDKKYIKKQGYNPVFQIRNLIIDTDITSAFLIMVKINNDSDLLYDSWINYSSPINGISICKTLCEQSYLKFIFLDEFGQEAKIIEVENSLKKEIETYIDKANQKYPWMMEEFDFVKKYIYKKYPNGYILWNSIATKRHEKIAEEELKRAGKKGSIRAKEIYYF